jgi:hypothetical protein
VQRGHDPETFVTSAAESSSAPNTAGARCYRAPAMCRVERRDGGRESRPAADIMLQDVVGKRREGFSFYPPTGPPAMIIAANATSWAAGNASVIDGGTQTVAAFQPSANTPEPASLGLLGLKLIAA